MKKMRKILGFTLFCLFVILAAAFVKAEIQSAGSTGGFKNEFRTSDSIYLRISANTCSPISSAKLYIVENKDVWTEAEELEDARDEGAQEIRLVPLPPQPIKIWDTPKSGNYDIILDCYKDYEKYDIGDPVDGEKDIGFSVTAAIGTGRASIGNNNIVDHNWSYDPEEQNLENEMLQLNLSTENENIQIKNITIEALGTGNDVEINKIEIYADKNNNGKLDEDEELIGDSQPAYTTDNSETIILLDYTLTKDLAENFLIVYVMKEETTPGGEFSLRVKSVIGEGEDSGESINFSLTENFIVSKTKTVLPGKTCLGTLTFALQPNPTERNSIVKTEISELRGCQNKTIFLRINPCGSSIKEDVGSCVLQDTTCEISFSATETITYDLCIDKNSDGDMTDKGEYTSQELSVIELEIKEENITKELNVTEIENITEVEEGEGVPITGGFISELGKKISEVGSFFILLEVTLLLILFVLVMIMFRLKPRKEE